MATRLREMIAKATFTTGNLSGGSNGGLLSNQQARTFLQDAIEATVILQDGDVFDSDSPTFEVPKINMSARIMRGGIAAKQDLEATRLDTGNRVAPSTGLVKLQTELFKGEVPVSDETFEDNIEHAGLADSIMGMIAEAVGRDLEQIAIQSDTADTDFTFGNFKGVIQFLVASSTSNKLDMSVVAPTSYKSMFKSMVAALPSRYRRNWNALAFYVPIAVADGYADELGNRGTANVGDSNVVDKTNLRYRGIEVKEVPLLTGTQNSVNYANFAYLAQGDNLKVGFHRRVRMEKFRDPREGTTSFLPTVRYCTAWAQDSAVVLASNVPAL